MANIFQKIGSAFGQYGMDNRMAADDFVGLPKDQRRAMQIQGLQNFANQMNLIGAQQSGNPQRVALAQQNIANAKAKQDFDQMYANLNDDQRRIVDLQRVGINLPTPTERKIIKGADGFNYYMDGTRVLPNVIGKDNKPDRKYERAADGFYRYVDDGSKVFGDVEMLKKGFEITTTDVLGAQKDERKTFETTNKGVKNFQQLLDAAQAADGAASYALMIKFIKQLDDSVVREGEVATFGGFQGALTNLKNEFSKTTGSGFTPEVKANMINLASQTANRLVNDYATYRAGKEKSYAAIGFDPNMVFAGLDFNLGGLDLTREYTPNDFEFIEFE